MKKIYIISFIFLSNFILHSFSDDYIFLNTENLNLEITNDYHYIKTDNENDYMVMIYNFILNGQSSYFEVLLKLPENYDSNKLFSKITQNSKKYDPYPYGSGKIIKYANDIGFTMLNEDVDRYAQDWGGDNTRDILLYKINTLNFEFLVQVFNVWPEDLDMPYIIDNVDIDGHIKNNSTIGERYSLLDEVFTSRFILNKLFIDCIFNSEDQ